ncbi:MAG TPA: DUF488 domain-containing protein [Smithellaceae bacterium]|nr:DUF488 domain-containing protein [Smithellaceae bacterium]HRS88533.1 DUF488 domain-containing protein [Smithellaceae bacterium]HRV25287.1 DUF488 domain-containing protein [Smithellaceae bacterium]
MLKTKSVASPIDKEKDGLRILVTCFRGRGLPSSRYYVWMSSLGPSEKLLSKMQKGKINWQQFAVKKEIFESREFDKSNETIKNHGQKFSLRLLKHMAKRDNVTLMCHCAEDQKQCHRHILKAVIESKKI